MPYYNAGDYYRGGDYYRAGGLRIGRILGGVARAAAGFVTGGPLGAATSLLPTGGGSVPTMAKQGRPEPGITGMVHRLVPGGHTGFIGGRRMNPMNVKAARRAVRRIKCSMKLLHSIEKTLPHRKARNVGGSPGVITRAEALKALRR